MRQSDINNLYGELLANSSYQHPSQKTSADFQAAGLYLPYVFSSEHFIHAREVICTFNNGAWVTRRFKVPLQVGVFTKVAHLRRVVRVVMTGNCLFTHFVVDLRLQDSPRSQPLRDIQTLLKCRYIALDPEREERGSEPRPITKHANPLP